MRVREGHKRRETHRERDRERETNRERDTERERERGAVPCEADQSYHKIKSEKKLS